MQGRPNAGVWAGRRSRPPHRNAALPPLRLAISPPGERTPPVSNKAQIKIRRAVGCLENANDHLLPGVQTGRRPDPPMAAPVTALNGRNSSEQFGRRDWRVIV